MPRSQSKTQFETKRLRLFVFFLALSLGIPSPSCRRRRLSRPSAVLRVRSWKAPEVSLPGTVITIVGDETKLTRTQTSNGNGGYDFVNLPIGSLYADVHPRWISDPEGAVDSGAGQPHRDRERHHAGRPGRTTITWKRLRWSTLWTRPTGTFWISNRSRPFRCPPAALPDSPFFRPG